MCPACRGETAPAQQLNQKNSPLAVSLAFIIIIAGVMFAFPLSDTFKGLSALGAKPLYDTYQGKPFDEWVKLLDDADRNTRELALNAVARMGGTHIVQDRIREMARREFGDLQIAAFQFSGYDFTTDREHLEQAWQACESFRFGDPISEYLEKKGKPCSDWYEMLHKKK